MRSLCFLAALTLVACAAKPPPMEPPVEEEVPFDGEASSNLPDFTDGLIDGGHGSPVDAGPIVVDMRCCRLNFELAGAGEPSGAAGRLVGEAFPLSEGLALSTAADGGYAASACLPLSTSTYYWYEFEWPTDDADAGGLPLEDGGFLVRVERYDPAALNYTTGTGVPRNFIPAVDDCALLDAGTEP
ncbi:MAG: hypothetical protein Q8L48_31805 [Archangium sp.]|nr:hypothetical protein [Archangium sp.]